MVFSESSAVAVDKTASHPKAKIPRAATVAADRDTEGGTRAWPRKRDSRRRIAAHPKVIALAEQEVAASGLAARYRGVRAHSMALAAPLSAEDQCVQSMPDASPTKWHLAHTTWFFETLVLAPHVAGYRAFDREFAYLFNSYYEALGPRHPRPQRGLLTRPSKERVLAYREHVDRAMERLLEHEDLLPAPLLATIELGLQHEQQHQELILTDIKHLFSCNVMLPVYLPRKPAPCRATALEWVAEAGGRIEIGHGGNGFAFDNETPRHEVLLRPFALASRLVTCGEYLEFIEDGAYRRPEFWLSDGWATVVAQGWQAPLYWLRDEAGDWSVFTLHGQQALDPAEPVCHLSFFEAAAYAAWAGARLPTEFEWEAVAAKRTLRERSADAPYHPAAANVSGGDQFHGEVWQWTRSSYDPYPGFRPLEGVAAEYNGKFMVGQLVLRGSSCATPAGHARTTYRNFFPPSARWQFSGLRLARDA